MSITQSPWQLLILVWLCRNIVMLNMQQSMASPNYTFQKCAELNIKATATASSLSTSAESLPSQASAGPSILSSPSPSPPPTSLPRSALPTGAIIGILVTAILIVCITVVLLAYLFWRSRAKQQHPNLSRYLIEQPSVVMDRNASIIHQFELPPSSYGNGVSGTTRTVYHCHFHV